jgi:two-component system NtrC family response regulator
MAKILVIDDDLLICNTMSRIIRDMEHEVKCALTLEEGLKDADSGNFDIVFLDVRLPDGNGLEQLHALHTASSSPEVIVTTSFADNKGAETALKSNVWDYLKKPLSTESIVRAITCSLQYREEKNTSGTAPTIHREDIIGNSPPIKACLDLVARAAHCLANVLITGETGTGKELFARAIHQNSPRAHKNFVVIDCAALPKTLIESLLFGYERGAFTGAEKTTVGLIEMANGGTLFLDEIGEMPLPLQRTLLRVLQERRFLRIGRTQETKSDFRLISASSRNLDELVKLGEFRSDILFRLRSIAIHLPPLRDRTEDIKELVFHYMKTHCQPRGLPLKGFSLEFFEKVESYSWPGNIRELFSTLEATIANALYEPTIFPKHLPPNIRIQLALDALGPTAQHDRAYGKSEGSSKALPKWQDFRKAYIEEGESRYLKDLMSITHGNIPRAAQLSCLSQPRLYELLRKYSIST